MGPTVVCNIERTLDLYQEKSEAKLWFIDRIIYSTFALAVPAAVELGTFAQLEARRDCLAIKRNWKQKQESVVLCE